MVGGITGILAIDGVAGVGKTTAIAKWDGKSILDGRWTIVAKFLDYNELRTMHPEFVNKPGKPFIELAYSLTHLLRTVAWREQGAGNDPAIHKNSLIVVDRSCIANLVYYLLFFFGGGKSYNNLYNIFSQYDNHSAALSKASCQIIEEVETSIKIVGKEWSRLRHHLIIAVADDPINVAERLALRGNFDASFASVDYIRSQNFLFKRFAALLPASIVSIMHVNDFFVLDEHQLINHLQSDKGFY